MVKQLFGLSYLDTESFLLWICGESKWLLGTVPDANTMQEHASDIPIEYLQSMLEETIRCMSENNVTVIIDATGLSLNQYGRWMNARHAKRKFKKKFIKLHIGVDLNSGAILVGVCSKGWKHDHKFGIQLLRWLRSAFRKIGAKLDSTLQDSAYLSREMVEEVEKNDGTPYIRAKKNSTTRPRHSTRWKYLIRFQKEQPDEFMKKYCYRVVIEGIISAFKRVFGSVLLSKKRHNQDLEVLCRLVLWNCMRLTVT